MAKALIGHLDVGQRSSVALTAENQRLRHRVADLEALVLRLQADNDRLSAAVRDAREVAEEMQPV